MQFIVRFIAGGLIVSAFALIGDILKPKSFAGLFGAAPSVALATLGLTIWMNGKPYAAQEARSMIAGSVALFVYALVTMWLILKLRLHAAAASVLAVGVWLAVAIGAWSLILR